MAQYEFLMNLLDHTFPAGELPLAWRSRWADARAGHILRRCSTPG